MFYSALLFSSTLEDLFLEEGYISYKVMYFQRVSKECDLMMIHLN